jgi:hypothetical protein
MKKTSTHVFRMCRFFLWDVATYILNMRQLVAISRLVIACEAQDIAIGVIVIYY